MQHEFKPFEVIEGDRTTTILDVLSDTHRNVANRYRAAADLFRGTPTEAIFSGYATFHDVSARIVRPRSGDQPKLTVIK